MSASSKMTTGRLAAELEVDLLERTPRPCARSPCPVATSPVSDTMLTVGCRTIPAPTGSPWPVMTLKTPGGKMSAGELRQPQRRQRRLLRRLQHDRVAGRERRADLPDRHHERVVPGRDRADDADRLPPDHARVSGQVLARGLALHAAAGAGEEAQVVHQERDLGAREADRLARRSRPRAPRAPRRSARSGRRASGASGCARPASCPATSRRPRPPRRPRGPRPSRCPSGTSPMASSLTGLMIGSAWPSTASTIWPLTKFL